MATQFAAFNGHPAAAAAMPATGEEDEFILAGTYLDDALHCRNVHFVPNKEETR